MVALDTTLINVKWVVKGNICKKTLCMFEYEMLKSFLKEQQAGKILTAHKVLINS